MARTATASILLVSSHPPRPRLIRRRHLTHRHHPTAVTARPVDMNAAQYVPVLEPRPEFSEDPDLPELGRLFDLDWVWTAFRLRSKGIEAEQPQRFRITQFVHRPGRTAFARYEVQFLPEAYLAPRNFVARLDKDKPAEFFLYPADSRLPGLHEVADPEKALRLVNNHVFTVPGRRARVQLVTYRPGYRAVVRHRFGRIKLYARVVRPYELPRLLDAYQITMNSGFIIPTLAGYWEEGGVLWLSEISGKGLRRRIRKGKAPDPHVILDGLDRLWRSPLDNRSGRPMRLDNGYRSAKRSFRHHLRESESSMSILNTAIRSLDPFVRLWQPDCTAHNDFYDDQLLLLDDGRMALVDFEEAGPGEPMLDVGNFLAHLLWSAKFASGSRAVASRRYYDDFRSAALDRFGWPARELTLREAVCLFRVCTNFIRHPQENWRDKLDTGLGLVNELLA